MNKSRDRFSGLRARSPSSPEDLCLPFGARSALVSGKPDALGIELVDRNQPRGPARYRGPEPRPL